MAVSDVLGEGYFYAHHNEARPMIDGQYYIIHSRRIGELVETGINYTPSSKRMIDVETSDPSEDTSIKDLPLTDDAFDRIELHWDDIHCHVDPLGSRREYPEEIHCELEPFEEEEHIAPMAENLGLANALYDPFLDGHILSFGYKVNEDGKFGCQFVQMEIQRMNPMERYLVLGIRLPERGRDGTIYENNLPSLLNQPLDPLNTALEIKEKEENENWCPKMDTRGPQSSRQSTDHKEPKHIVFRRFAQETPWVEPDFQMHDDVEFDNEIYKIGLFCKNFHSAAREWEFLVHVAEQYQDIWTEEEDGRLHNISSLMCHLSSRVKSLAMQIHDYAEAWEYHRKRFTEMAKEMRLGEVAGACDNPEDGLLNKLQWHKAYDLDMRRDMARFTKKWSARWPAIEVATDIVEAVAGKDSIAG